MLTYEWLKLANGCWLKIITERERYPQRIDCYDPERRVRLATFYKHSKKKG